MKRPSKFSLRVTPSSDIEQKILSVRKLHNNELRNMNGDLLLQIEKQKEEIRLLKRMELRQAKIIEKFDNSKNKLPSLIDSHNKELKMLREQIRNLKFRYRKSEESLREADAELERTKNKLNKYKILLEEEQLIDRAELTRKLILAEQRTEESEKKIQVNFYLYLMFLWFLFLFTYFYFAVLRGGGGVQWCWCWWGNPFRESD